MLITSLLISSMFFYHVERPALVMSQGMTEGRMNKYVVGKAGEQGAYQIRSKYWGAVPQNLYHQTLQNEQVLNTLLKSRTVPQAVAKYNGIGHKAKKYAKKVLAKALRIQVMGVMEA